MNEENEKVAGLSSATELIARGPLAKGTDQFYSQRPLDPDTWHQCQHLTPQTSNDCRNWDSGSLHPSTEEVQIVLK